MRLSGGRYTLRELADGLTGVSVETRYVSTKWPRWFWRPLERLVCHWFHRYLLGRCDETIESKLNGFERSDMPELMPPVLVDSYRGSRGLALRGLVVQVASRRAA